MYTAWLFYQDHFKDVYLPDSPAWTRQIELTQFETGWRDDVSFPIRLLDGRLYMTLAPGFRWEDNRKAREAIVKPNSYFRVFGPNNIVINVIVKDIDRRQLCFVKYALPNRNITVGRDATCDICDAESTMSGVHGVFSFAGNVANYTDRSSNGAYVNGRHVCNNGMRIQVGDIVTFPTGLKLVMLSNCIAVNRPGVLRQVKLQRLPARRAPQIVATDEPLRDVFTEYHRAPRMLNKPVTDPFEVEPPLAKNANPMQPLWQQVGPSATMVLPMVMGSMVASQSGGMLSGIVMIGTSSLLAVMWGIISHNYAKKQAVTNEKSRVNLYRRYIEETEAILRDRNESEYRRLNETFPNVGQCAAIPGDKSRRLWNRMPSHPDFLHLRLGTGDVPLPSPLTTQLKKLSLIDDPLREEPERLIKTYSTIQNAPITVSLRGESVIGVLGGAEGTLFAQGMLMQIATLHSYHDVRIAVLTDPGAASTWDWTRWLPHVFASEDRDMRMIASDDASVHKVLAHIEDVLVMRSNVGEGEAPKEESKDKKEDLTKRPLPHYVIFCTNAKLLENEPVTRKLLTNKLGMTLIMVATSHELLPKECRYVINTSAKPGLLHESDGGTRKVDYEYPNRSLLTGFSRQIAPLRVQDAAESAAIPTLVSFLDTCNVRRVEDLDIWRYWSENHTFDGLRSVIGYTSGSRPFILDISENYHGPHGLVAGTTGSGKSVMLQTYILSLSMNYSPEEVQFILIDYKGGGMADAFRTLPHVSGIIDNLQGNRVISRALASLNGEIHRRERLFKEVGVKDIIEYTKTFYRDANAPKLPHLVIIADEFAELKSDQPEFMKELVSASRVGRSLGVHLILATQKPSGSVSDEIWANSRFHLCLRVQTVGDSRDMLKRPDAAYIKGSGRCFIQIGNDESFDQVQTCYSGLEYDPNVPRPEEMPQLLDAIGAPVKMPKRRTSGPANRKKTTQMDAVLERINQVAKEHRMPAARRMWLPEMPSHIYYNTLPQFSAYSVRSDYTYYNDPRIVIPMGLADDTANQRYVPFNADLTAMRNLMLVGLAATGKTAAVQSMVYALANMYDPEHLQMYILSLSSRSLEPLRRFPHVGDICFEDETAEIKRFINILYQEQQRRSKLFAASATDSFLEYNRNTSERVPAIVVFVDRYEHLRTIFDNDDTGSAMLSSLIREGSSRGIHFIVTALAKTEIPFRLHSFFGGVALQLAERADYSEVIGTRVPYDMPAIAILPGRGLASIDGEVMEVQLALAGTDRVDVDQPFPVEDDIERYKIESDIRDIESISDIDRAAFVGAFADDLAAHWKGAVPPPIPRIPERPTWRSFFALPAFKERIKTTYQLPIGYDVESGSPLSFDLETNFSMLITGAKKTGKTNMLKLIARVMNKLGAEVHIIAGPEWKSFADGLALPLHSEKQDIINYMHEFQQNILAPRNPLKVAAREQGMAALKKQALEFKPYAMIIDNAARFNTDFNDDGLEEEVDFMQTILSQLCARADHFNMFFFLSASFQDQMYFMQEPLQGLLSQNRGICMGGKISECNALGLSGSLPSAITRMALPAGQGHIYIEDQVRHVVVPLADVES